jgi:pimeloyl-ACP methyl ester carboxylesterase
VRIAALICAAIGIAGAAPAAAAPKAVPVDCGFVFPEGRSAACYDVRLPEDRGKPDGRAVTLRVVVLMSPEEDEGRPPLLYITGGPGGVTGLDAAGMTEWWAVFDRFAWLRRQKLILFDQRGIGLSGTEAGESCHEFVPPRLDALLGYDVPGADQERAIVLAAARTCLDSLPEHGAELQHYLSADTAADIADLRVALGYGEWVLWGTSYGTRVALTVLRDRPEGVAAAILEGVLPPDARDLEDDAANADAGYDALFARCAADPACGPAFPDLRPRLAALIARLEAEPVEIRVRIPGSERTRARIDGNTLQSLTLLLLRSAEAYWLPRLIADVESGETRLLALTLRGIVEQVMRRDALADYVQLTVLCGDERPADPGWIDAVAAQVTPLTGKFAELDGTIEALCDIWPVSRPEPRESLPVATDTPTLLLSGEHDPATPPRFAAMAAAHLPRSQSFVFPGMGHGVVFENACAAAVVAAFLDDPSNPVDLRCLRNPPVPPFAMPYDGP